MCKVCEVTGNPDHDVCKYCGTCHTCCEEMFERDSYARQQLSIALGKSTKMLELANQQAKESTKLLDEKDAEIAQLKAALHTRMKQVADLKEANQGFYYADKKREELLARIKERVKTVGGLVHLTCIDLENL